MWPTPDETEALLLSLKVAAWCVALGLPLSLGVAYLLARRRFVGHGLLNALVHVPLVLPPVVTGYLLLLAFGRRAPLGRFLEETLGLVLAFRWTGAVLAALVMALPLMVRPIRLAIEGVDRRLEAAAATLGASSSRIFLTVTLPLALPGLAAAAVMGFARALGEFGATITFVANIPGETRTLPLAIYTAIQVPGGDAAAMRLTLIAVLVSVLALVASEAWSRRLARRLGLS